MRAREILLIARYHSNESRLYTGWSTGNHRGSIWFSTDIPTLILSTIWIRPKNLPFPSKFSRFFRNYKLAIFLKRNQETVGNSIKRDSWIFIQAISLSNCALDQIFVISLMNAVGILFYFILFCIILFYFILFAISNIYRNELRKRFNLFFFCSFFLFFFFNSKQPVLVQRSNSGSFHCYLKSVLRAVRIARG